MPLWKPSLAVSLIGVSVIVTFVGVLVAVRSTYHENLIRTESNIEWAMDASNRNLARQIELLDFTRLSSQIEEISSKNLSFLSKTDERGGLLSLKEAERRHVIWVVEDLDGNREIAAAVLGISERHLYRLLKRFREEESPERTDQPS